MQTKLPVESMRWVVAQLVVIAVAVASLVHMVLPSHLGKFAGGFLVAVGALHVLFYKRTGQKFFAKTQSKPGLVAGFWARSGENGTQRLFFGIGVILILAGSVFIVLAI